jgi:hypothetical protein
MFLMAVMAIAFSIADGQPGRDTTGVMLSPKPGSRELVRVLLPAARGKSDPFVILPMVIDLADSAVPAIFSVLSQDSSFSGGELKRPTPGEVRRARLLGILSLEAIGTQRAFNVLFGIASSSVDVELRAVALRALGTAYHTNGYLQSNVPDKELIHLLFQNVDDTTLVSVTQKTIAQTAREGLIAWMNVDPGDPRKAGSSPPPLRSREDWWQSAKGSIVWDAASKVFHLQ